MEDDRVLAALTRCVFAAGFRWKVIEAKWSGFEEAFEGFCPTRLADWTAEDLDRLVMDSRIVRNPVKIRATLANAVWLTELAASHGSAARWIAKWPSENIIGLWAAMKSGGSRLGGLTGPRALRLLGKDTFLLTPDVVTGLRALGLLTASETSKTGMAQAQEVFSAWAAETGRPMAELSVMVARSEPSTLSRGR